MKKILSLLLTLCLLIPTAFATGAPAPSPQAPSPYSFIDQAIENGRRVKGLVTFDLDNEVFEQTELKDFAPFLNDLSIETTYQKNGDFDQFWNKTFFSGEDTLLSLQSLTYADDVYLSTNLLPTESLAFTPKELLNFFSTLAASFSGAFRDSADISTALMYGQFMLSSLAESIGDSATWTSITDLFSAFDISPAQLINDELVDALESFINETVTLLKTGEVSSADLSAYDNAPANGKATQYVFNEKEVEALFTLMKKWFTQEEYVNLWFSMVSLLPQMADMSPQEFSENALEAIEEIEVDCANHLVYPVVVTLWHQNDTLIQGDLTCSFADEPQAEKPDMVTFNATYLLVENEDGSTQHQNELTFFDDDHELLLALSLKPTHSLVVDESEILSSFIDLSFSNTEREDGELKAKQIGVKIAHEVIMSENNHNDAVNVAICLLDEEDGTVSSGTMDLNWDTLSTLAEEDAQLTSTVTFDLGGILGNGRAFTIKNEISSAAPEKDTPPQKVTRLGKMDQDALMTWADQVAGDVAQVLEGILSLLPLENFTFSN